MTHLGPSLRRAKVRERPRRRAAVALVVSAALNAAALVLLVRAGAFDLGVPKDVKRVALAPISAGDWAANRAIRPNPAAPERVASEPFAMPRPPPKPPPEPESDRNPKGQVVDIARPADPKAPKDARFLAEHDSSVEKESRSRHAKSGYERTLPTPSAPGAQSAPPPGQDGESERSVPGLPGAVARAAPAAVPPRPAPAAGEGGDLAAGQASTPAGAPAPAPGAGDGGLRLKGAPERLSLPPGTLARLAGGPAPDHLEGVEEGEGTFLNARGWKYATFFNRMKKAIDTVWDPYTPYNARDPDRSLFGTRDRLTRLDVTLDDGGNLKKLEVAQSSGLDFLDVAAVKAFETAAPFPNPPRGLVDPNGEIRFAFGLFVEVRGPREPGITVFVTPLTQNPSLPQR